MEHIFIWWKSTILHIYNKTLITLDHSDHFIIFRSIFLIIWDIISLGIQNYELNIKFNKCFPALEILHNNQEISSSNGVSYSISGGRWYMVVLIPTKMLNHLYWSRFYINYTIQVSFFNVTLRMLIMNIKCGDLIKKLDY